MFHATFAVLQKEYQPPVDGSMMPCSPEAPAGSATLPVWRNRPSPLRARVSQR